MSNVLEEAKELRKIWSGFQASRVLLTANNLRVFDHLKRPKTAPEVAKAINTNLRATELLLNALASIGLLKKVKNKFKNAQIAGRFLVKGGPYYQGDIIRHADSLWKNWTGLDEVMQTGRPSRKAHEHDAFIMGMHNLAVLKAKTVMDKIGMKDVRAALDLGGGPGTYAVEMSRRGVSVTLFDFPDTIKIAEDMMRRQDIKGIGFIRGDFLRDDFGGGYDLVFISQVFHAYSKADNIRILEKSRKALNPGGRVAVQEFYIEEDMTHPPHSALFSINMLVNTDSGRCYSPKEIGGFLREAGFKKIEKKPLADTILVEGTIDV